jgi:carbon-monoxide dehydrogenase small subunit
LNHHTPHPYKRILSLTVNGQPRELAVAPNQTLLDLLRVDLGLTGTKHGCGEGDCGACVVLLDGLPVNACLVLALETEGRHVETIEGLAAGQSLHPLQQAFIDAGSVQCGYCTPGMILASKALLARNPSPSALDVRRALSGNLCRCTGYHKIVEGVLLASERMGDSHAKEEEESR